MASEIVLVNVSGEDKPGLMAMLTSTLAQYQVRVLDIGQAVIHNELNLGMLVEIMDGVKRESVLAELESKVKPTGVTVRFTSIANAQYEDWVNSQGKPRYIVTLLTDHVDAVQLAAVTNIIQRHGLNIDAIRRLSGRLPLKSVPDGKRRTSVEMSLRGTLSDNDSLKEELMAAAAEFTFDFSVQKDTVYRRNRRLVAFDMDSTLIDVEVIDELAKRHGVGDQVAEITRRAMSGEFAFRESFEQRARLLKGLPVSALSDVAEALSLNDGARRLILSLQHLGYKTAIISGGFRYIGERLQEKLGIDYVFANELQISNGVLTGEVQGDVIDAQRKAELLAEIAFREGISSQQIIAIGDGANDLPMLSAAGLGVAYHAKPVVREIASHAISNYGLDSILYLMGFSDRDIEQALEGQSSVLKS